MTSMIMNYTNIGRMLHLQFEMWIFELRKAKEQLQNKNTL